MEFLIECILELILEGSIEISSNQKIPRIIRYPLIFFLILFFLAVISLIFFTGIIAIQQNVLLGIIFIVLGGVLLILSILKFRKIYLKKTRKR